MELLTFTIAAGETKRFERAGRYLEIIASASALTIGLYDAAGARVEGAIGALSGLYMEGGYSAIEISSALAQTVTLLVTDGRGGSRRQPGVVQVVDTEREKVTSAVAFRAAGLQAGGGLGSPRVQVWNPVGSGKLLYVNGVQVGVSAADGYAVQTSDVAAPTLYGPAVSCDTAGANGLAECRIDNTATVYTALRLLSTGFLAASAETYIQFARPILIRPGRGLHVTPGGTAPTIRCAFDLEEYSA